jgi:hypothetical protein
MYIAYHIIWPSNACGLILWSALSMAWFSSVSRLVYIVVSSIVGLNYNETSGWPGPENELILHEGQSLLLVDLASDECCDETMT